MIKLENITKTYGGKNLVHALNGVDLTINDGEILVLLARAVPVNRRWSAALTCSNGLHLVKSSLMTKT